jgi:hypothetical protein
MHSVSSGKLLFLQDFLSKFSKHVLGFARVDLQMIKIHFFPFPAIYVIFLCGNPWAGHGQAFAEGRMRYLFAEGGDAHCYRGLGQSSEAQAFTVNHRSDNFLV